MSDDAKIELPRTILFVESSQAMRKLMVNNLELYTGAKIVCLKNSEELADFFKTGKSANLIVTEDMVDGEYTSMKIVYFVNSQKINIPVIVMGMNSKLAGKATMIEKENWRELIKEAAKLMHVTSETMMEMVVPDYYPFQMASLLSMREAPVDLYLEEADGINVWLLAQSKIDKKQIEDFLLKGTKTFYVGKYHRLEFVEKLSAELMILLNDPNLSFQNRVAATQTAMENTCTLIEKFGMDKKSIDSSRTAVESIYKMAMMTPGLDDLIDVIARDTSSYVYKHTLMISIVSHQLISKMEWGNTEQQKKISMAAFFHDVSIADDRLCKIHSSKELKDSNLPETLKQKIERHAFHASELMAKMPDLPMGTESIVLQHHGTLNGIGFADEHLDNRLSPLSIVFLVTEDFVHRMLAEEKPDRKAILLELSLKYNKGQYRKCYEALEKAVAKV